MVPSARGYAGTASAAIRDRRVHAAMEYSVRADRGWAEGLGRFINPHPRDKGVISGVLATIRRPLGGDQRISLHNASMSRKIMPNRAGSWGIPADMSDIRD
jgi:hypothetical protein